MLEIKMLGTLLCLFATFSLGPPVIAQRRPLQYQQLPAKDGHRCGVCPTYFQKICAFDFNTNSTFIFDNHCVMDMYNCLNGAEFSPVPYEKCLYFGNFAYVHGYKSADQDYDEDNVIIKGSKKNPDFA